MRVAVIVNPISGARGRPTAGRRRAALVTAVLAEEGLPGEVHVTEGAGHAIVLARAAVARGATLVVAWGGDGTVNEVATALAFGEAALGIVPAGSGNGLARALGVPGQPAAALRAALRGPERAIDVGTCGERLFVNLAGIGLDAVVAARFNARAAGRRGVGPYVTLAIRELVRYRPGAYTLAVDGEPWHGRALVVLCANGREYGGGARVAPHARLDDGKLDLVVATARSPLAMLWHARRLFTGTLAAAPGVLTRPIRHLAVEADEPLLFHVDGEPVQGSTRLTVRVHPRALRVRAPAWS